MTDREKLIDLIVSADISLFGTGKPYAEVYADYLLENGVIVPPCKVGTEIYFVAEWGNKAYKVINGTLISYSLDAASLWFNCRYDCGLNYWHPIYDFGNKVFQNKEEAEKALENLKNTK